MPGTSVMALRWPGRPPAGAPAVVAAFPRWQDGPFSLDGIDRIGGSLDGMLAERVVLPATALVEIPDDLGGLTDAEAATLPVAGLTAWNALTNRCPFPPSRSIEDPRVPVVDIRSCSTTT